VKPPSSIRKEQETVTLEGKPATISVEGRHDPCICPRVVPVAESMVALTIFDHLMRQRLLRRESKIRALRDTIDLVDQNILLLLAERQGLVRQIGDLKRKRKAKILDKGREAEILRKQLPIAGQLGLDREFTANLFRAIFQLARSTQRKEERK
jgi:chorismate mutase